MSLEKYPVNKILQSVSLHNSTFNYMQMASKRESILERKDDKTQVSDFFILISQINREIGIKVQLEQNDLIRLWDITTKYFSDFSLSEIKLAFEFMVIGEIDAFLPKDREGNPDKNHYQYLSVEFYSRILRAYKRKKEKLITTIQTKHPTQILQLNDSEKRVNREQYVSIILDWLAEYQNGGKPNIFLPSVTLKEFNLIGLTEETVEVNPTPEQINLALLEAIKSNSNNNKKMIESYKKGEIPKEIVWGLEEQELKKKIYSVFDKIIEQKIDLKKLML